MTRLLYINASPRSESASHHAAQIFLDGLKNDVVTQRIDLFKIQLPEITNTITNAANTEIKIIIPVLPPDDGCLSSSD